MKAQIKIFLRRQLLRLLRKLVNIADARLHAAEVAAAREEEKISRRGRAAGCTTRNSEPPFHGAKGSAASSITRKKVRRRAVTVPESLSLLAKKLLSSGLSAEDSSSALKNMGYSVSEVVAAVEA
jgi:hypothetical protein